MPAINCIADFDIKRPVRKILRNGIVLNILDTGKEDVIRLDLVMGCGQIDQDFPLQAMMTNRMLREGTARMTSAQIAERLDFYGAWLDLSSSVNSGFVTLYSLGKFFGHTVRVLAEMVKEPVFPARELEIVAETNKQMYLVNSERVEIMARKRLNTELFGKNHPLGKYAELNDYDNLTTEMLKNFYSKFYYSGNCTIFVAGKVTDEVLGYIEECFGNETWGNNRVKEKTVLPEPAGFKNKRVKIKKDNCMQSSVKMGIFMPDRMHRDFLDLRVMNTMLGGYFGSRLMKNIREDKGYTYGIASGIMSYPGNSILVISTETDNRYVENVIGEVRREIDRMKNEKAGKEELDMVKSYMIGDICRAYENALSISEAWIYVLTTGVDDDFFDRSVESIRNISEERIKELACKYLDWDRMVEVVAGNI